MKFFLVDIEKWKKKKKQMEKCSILEPEEILGIM